LIISLTREQKRLLDKKTKEKYPIEACGLLFGDMNCEEAVVRKIVATHNILESSTNFQVDPEEFLKILSKAEKEDVKLIGFFHSHPATPQPSVTDIKYMKLWPENIWLIISSLDYQIAAYQTVDSSLRKVRLKVKY